MMVTEKHIQVKNNGELAIQDNNGFLWDSTALSPVRCPQGQLGNVHEGGGLREEATKEWCVVNAHISKMG